MQFFHRSIRLATHRADTRCDNIQYPPILNRRFRNHHTLLHDPPAPAGVPTCRVPHTSVKKWKKVAVTCSPSDDGDAGERVDVWWAGVGHWWAGRWAAGADEAAERWRLCASARGSFPFPIFARGGILVATRAEGCRRLARASIFRRAAGCFARCSGASRRSLRRMVRGRVSYGYREV